jgi:hypothetical protein
LEDIEEDPISTAVMLRKLSSRRHQSIRRIVIPRPEIYTDIDFQDIPPLVRWYRKLGEELQRFTELRSLQIDLPENADAADIIVQALITPKLRSYSLCKQSSDLHFSSYVSW